MTTLRITADIRDDIVGRAMSDIYGPKWDETIAAEAVLADRARVCVYRQDVLDKVEALPEEWNYWAGTMEFNTGGWSIKLSHSTSQRYPEKTRYGGYKPYVKDEKLTEEIRTHARERDALKEQQKAAKSALETLIRNCRTLKKLTEMWPEGHAYFKHLEGTSNKTPTVRADTVNAMLGLPKDTTATAAE